jgi:hypothetical protein
VCSSSSLSAGGSARTEVLAPADSSTRRKLFTASEAPVANSLSQVRTSQRPITRVLATGTCKPVASTLRRCPDAALLEPGSVLASPGMHGSPPEREVLASRGPASFTTVPPCSLHSCGLLPARILQPPPVPQRVRSSVALPAIQLTPTAVKPASMFRRVNI